MSKEPDMPVGDLSTEERSLRWYLEEITKVELLSREEEAELARRVKGGDHEALERLTKANLRFVVSVAKQYQGLPLCDLISEGNVGLIRAAKKFDETKGFKFISYAVWWIKQAILQALGEQSRILRLPMNRVGDLHKIGKTLRGLEQEFGREPSMGEIADELEMSLYDIMSTIKASRRHLSLDGPRNGGEDGYKLLDVLEDQHQPSPDEVFIEDSLKRDVRRVLSTLTKREAKVISLYFGIDQDRSFTLEEIGEKFGLTRERVRQIKEKAIRRLRHVSRGRLLRAYWEV